MREALLDLADEALALARSAGATEAAATTRRSRDVSWSMRAGKIEQVKDATSRGLELAVYVEGRYATHSTSDLRPDALRSFVTEAVALTRALQPDPFRALPDPSLFATEIPELDLTDPTLAGLDRDTRLGWLGAMDAEARNDARVLSATADVSDHHGVHAYATSNGFAGTMSSTEVWLSSSVTVRDAGDRRPEESDWAGGHFRTDLVDAQALGRSARERALARLGAAKGPTRVATMVVDPRAAGNLVRRLLGPAQGRAIQQQQSFWAGRLGQKVLSERLTITDEPLRKRGLASRPFDGEGLRARELTLVDAGVLANVYTDTYYAKKGKLPLTTGGPSNRVVRPGDRDLAAWIREVGSGIYVTSWLGGNADASTGDFSLGLGGFLIENGKVGAPVGEMNVTGNLVQLFAGLVGLGNDPFPYTSLLTPTLVIEGVNFSGA